MQFKNVRLVKTGELVLKLRMSLLGNDRVVTSICFGDPYINNRGELTTATATPVCRVYIALHAFVFSGLSDCLCSLAFFVKTHPSRLSVPSNGHGVSAASAPRVAAQTVSARRSILVATRANPANRQFLRPISRFADAFTEFAALTVSKARHRGTGRDTSTTRGAPTTRG
jgi:hypothetical protein